MQLHNYHSIAHLIYKTKLLDKIVRQYIYILFLISNFRLTASRLLAHISDLKIINIKLNKCHIHTTLL